MHVDTGLEAESGRYGLGSIRGTYRADHRAHGQLAAKVATLRFVRVLGVDFGERRIGLAVSDVSRTLARPLCMIAPNGSLADRATAVASEITRLAGEADGLARVVVGLPRSLDGRAHAQTARVLAFVEALRGATCLPVAVQDERLSSREAESRLAVQEKDWRKRKPKLDAAAAAVILQDYLDQMPAADTIP